MKTFKFWWLALVAIVMSASFTSCSKDNPDGEDLSNEKKLTKIISTQTAENYSSTYTYTYTFTYNDNGKLIEATELATGGSSRTEKFAWGDNTIKINGTYQLSSDPARNYTSTCTFENGLVQLSEDGERFSYNSANRLIQYAGLSFTWDKDKLVSISSGYSDVTYTYGESCKKGYFLVFDMEDLLFMAHPELAGIRTKQLPTSATYTYEDNNSSAETSSYTYEFDPDGYPTKITISGKNDTYTHTLTWK